MADTTRRHDHDDLTGLANRRILYRMLQEFLDAGHQLSAVVCTLDGFTDINDAYGHPEGDRVLRAVANRLRAAVSGLDVMLARHGGVTFVALCPTVDVGVVRTALEHAFRTPFVVGDSTRTLSTSVGVGESRDGTTPDALIAAAARRVPPPAVIDLTRVAPLPANRARSNTS